MTTCLMYFSPFFQDVGRRKGIDVLRRSNDSVDGIFDRRRFRRHVRSSRRAHDRLPQSECLDRLASAVAFITVIVFRQKWIAISRRRLDARQRWWRPRRRNFTDAIASSGRFPSNLALRPTWYSDSGKSFRKSCLVQILILFGCRHTIIVSSPRTIVDVDRPRIGLGRLFQFDWSSGRPFRNDTMSDCSGKAIRMTLLSMTVKSAIKASRRPFQGRKREWPTTIFPCR